MTVFTLEQQVVKTTTVLVAKLVDAAVSANSVVSAKTAAQKLLAYDDFKGKITQLVGVVVPVGVPSWSSLISTLFIKPALYPTATSTGKQLFTLLRGDHSLLGRLVTIAEPHNVELLVSFSSFSGLPITLPDVALANQQMLSPVLANDSLYKIVLAEAKAQDIKNKPNPLPIFSQNKESYVFAGWVKDSLLAKNEAKKAEAKAKVDAAKKDPSLVGVLVPDGSTGDPFMIQAQRHMEAVEKAIHEEATTNPATKMLIPPATILVPTPSPAPNPNEAGLASEAPTKEEIDAAIASPEWVQIEDSTNMTAEQALAYSNKGLKRMEEYNALNLVVDTAVEKVNKEDPAGYIAAAAEKTTGVVDPNIKTSVLPEVVEAKRNLERARVDEINNLPPSPNAGVDTHAKVEQIKQTEQEATSKKAGVPAPTPAPLPPGKNTEEVAKSLEAGNTANDVKSDGVGGADIGGRSASGGESSKTTTSLDESFIPADSGVYKTDLSLSFDNTADLFKSVSEAKTQLMVEDLNDFRAIQTVKPFFTDAQSLSYFRIVTNGDISPMFVATDGSLQADPKASDPFGGGKAIYNQFFIKQIQEAYNEKFQLTDTLSTGQALFSFGEKPEIWSIQGQLINDNVNNWLMKFREAWHSKLRISKLVESSSFLRITIPEIRLVVDCYPVGLTINHSDETSVLPSFGMQFYVKSVQSMPNQRLSINDATTAYLNTTLSLLSQKAEDKNDSGVPDVGLKNSANAVANGVVNRLPTKKGK